jgi:hypothetical protein
MTSAVQQRMKYLDVIFGFMAGGISIALLNSLVALACGLVSLTILFYRLRREHRHRNRPPE